MQNGPKFKRWTKIRHNNQLENRKKRHYQAEKDEMGTHDARNKQTVEWSTVSQDIPCLSRQSYMNAAMRLNKTTKVDIGVGKN